MQVLIIDDDQNKIEHLQEFLAEVLPQALVEACLSYQSGLREVLQKEYDLVLLDMTMPTYDITAEEDGGSVRIFAGREVLRQMHRRKVKTPVIIVTQFDAFGEGESRESLDQLMQALQQDFRGNYLGTVYYNTAIEEWKTQLKQLVQSRVASR